MLWRRDNNSVHSRGLRLVSGIGRSVVSYIDAFYV